MSEPNKFKWVDGKCLNEWGEDMSESLALETWWGLSYAQFLTIPRVVMQSMPTEWQDRMAALLYELDERQDWRPEEGCYHVQLDVTEWDDEPERREKQKMKLVSVPERDCNYRHGWRALRAPVTLEQKVEQVRLLAKLGIDVGGER